MRRAALVAAVLSALAGAACSGSGVGSPQRTPPTEPRTASSATPIDPSTSAAAPAGMPTRCGPGARAFWLPGPDGTKLEANAFGRGRAAAVFLHQAGGVAGMCGFWPFARWLAVHRTSWWFW